jgi:hypothetical protein
VPLAVVDLARFSFVLNWIVNVNEFALAVGALLQPGWERLGGCYVERRETTTVYQTTGPTYVIPPHNSIYTPVRDFEAMLVAGERTVRRVPVESKLPTLTLRADPLRWTRDLRLVDAALLLTQQLKGKGVRRMLTLG